MSVQTGHSNARRAIVGAAVTILLGASALVATGRLGESAEAVELPPVAHQMRAFSNRPLADAGLPGVVQQARDNLNQRGPGQVMPGEARLLASGLGKNRVSVYALPTTGGAVCVVVSEVTYATTCVDSFERKTGNVQWINYSGTDVPQTITGVAADAAADVKVLVKGVSQDATLRRNAFFWQADTSVTRDDIQALLVRQDDGTNVRVDLAR